MKQDGKEQKREVVFSNNVHLCTYVLICFVCVHKDNVRDAVHVLRATTRTLTLIGQWQLDTVILIHPTIATVCVTVYTRKVRL